MGLYEWFKREAQETMDAVNVSAVANSLSTSLNMPFEKMRQNVDEGTVTVPLDKQQAANLRNVFSDLTEDEKKKAFGDLTYRINDKNELVVTGMKGLDSSGTKKLGEDLNENRLRGPVLQEGMRTGSIKHVLHAMNHPDEERLKFTAVENIKIPEGPVGNTSSHPSGLEPAWNIASAPSLQR